MLKTRLSQNITIGRALEKQRTILDAAVRVFAERGFHSCRVSDVADEAGVAYGLVYHYFSSKEEILDRIFLERWEILMQAIVEIDEQDELDAREKLYEIASFIIDSYQYNPDVMKVIIVEVTRAANSFGQTHLEKITEAFDLIGSIVESAQINGTFRSDISPTIAALAFYGVIEQILTGWIFGLLPAQEADFEDAKRLVVETVCGGLEKMPIKAAQRR